MNIPSIGLKRLLCLLFLTLINHCIVCDSGAEMYRYVLTRQGRLELVYHSTMTSSKEVCGLECGRDESCLSASYQNSTGKCQFSPLPRAAIGTNIVGDTDWVTMSRDNEWFLVFLGVAGNGVDVVDAWINGDGVTIDDIHCMQLNFSGCTGLHYRNEAVDSWDDLNVKEVKYSLYKDSQVVAYVIFNGKDKSINSWFHEGNIITSSWNDIKSHSFNYFSIDGFNARRFLISLNHGGCLFDAAYTVAITSLFSDCDIDDQESYPQFFYSNTSSYGFPGRYEGFDRADAITIHIKT